MSTVLFLDLDGVLNSMAYLRTLPPERRVHDALDPVAVGLLNEVCARTGAVVVISSAWRERHDVGRIREMLVAAGSVCVVAGATPLPFQRPGLPPLMSWSLRGHEIEHYLDEHPDVRRYAIVDDEDGMLADQLRRTVRTTFETGLQRKHVETLVALLGAAGGRG